MNEFDNNFNGEEEALTEVTPTPTPRKFNLGNDKDRAEYFKQLQTEAITKLYKSDPLIRHSLDVQVALNGVEKPSKSVVNFEEAGNVIGVSRSVIRGANATTKNQADLIRAIRANAYKRYGVTNG
jgi:hypothetical protein